jgi:hypothetical protein
VRTGSAARAAPAEGISVREAVAARARVVRRPSRRVRRAGVAGPGEELREEHGEDDLAGRLGVRPAATARTQREDEQAAQLGRVHPCVAPSV